MVLGVCLEFFKNIKLFRILFLNELEVRKLRDRE